MAYTPLRTDFKDDILDSSNYKRKYKQVVNNDGTFSFQDETTYQQVGSDYGAKEVNEERAAINNVYESKLVALDDVALVTEEGFFVDALAVKELNSNLVNAKNELTNISNKLTALSDSINNLGSTKTVKLANKSSSNGVATYTDYVTLPSAGSYVIYCNATMSGTPTSGISNLGIQVNSVDGTGGFHSVGSCSHNGFAIDLNGFYVLTTKVSNEKIRLRLYQNGGYAETWKNISVYYKKIL